MNTLQKLSDIFSFLQIIIKAYHSPASQQLLICLYNQSNILFTATDIFRILQKNDLSEPFKVRELFILQCLMHFQNKQINCHFNNKGDAMSNQVDYYQMWQERAASLNNQDTLFRVLGGLYSNVFFCDT